MLPVTSILTAVLAVALVALSLPVALRRRGLRVSAGDGGDEVLLRRIRAQGNFIEYAPMALIAIGLCELNGAHPATLWGLGGLLLAGRALHAAGLLTGTLPARALGMVLTFACLLAAAARLALATL